MRRKSGLKGGLCLQILLTICLIVWPWRTVSSSAIPGPGGVGGKTVTSASRTVTTRSGRVQGFVLSFPNPLPPVEVFLGIPYATPPVGINRFSPTRNPVPWTEIRMADRHAPSCPQRFPDISNETESLKYMSKQRRDYLLRIEPHLRNQSEDCLYLSIYAPAQGRYRSYLVTRLTTRSRLHSWPVTIFIPHATTGWKLHPVA